MNKIIRSTNTINLAVKSKKIKTLVKINPSVEKVLNILVDYNLIEYKRLDQSTADVYLKYKDNNPILKKINYMGGTYKNSISFNGLKKEVENKKAIFIVLTNIGTVSGECAVKNKQGGIVLFKLTI